MCGLSIELRFNPDVTMTAEAAVSDLLGGFLKALKTGGGLGGVAEGRMRVTDGCDNLVEQPETQAPELVTEPCLETVRRNNSAHWFVKACYV